MKVEKAIFAAGCFWGVQHQFERIPGVLNTTVGYTGGPEANPTYTQVKAHMTHHVEAIFVDYDADMVSYVDLCKLFFEIHDPSQTDGIGPDLGPQYRSMIFYMDEKQKSEAEDCFARKVIESIPNYALPRNFGKQKTIISTITIKREENLTVIYA